ncbi:pyridoxamine 5'-phosphate oxidase family protein [uncultured Roseobacter sp.]|uniref:pyridoxamine 5'-phosphate oxidase family protein n=1 Tax=uncultured Roseobacter sp. TaxID=114847 RepID=UPI0026187D8E|nr:pyridoxamine 5'-phosphate oxidase family protein [uncultured Roseobacter sp.]
MPTPDEFYTPAQRALQKEGKHEGLSEVVVHAIVRDALEEIHTDYIRNRDYFFLSTVNGKGEPTVSYKGGDVGFVKVLSPNRLIFPNYDGNGMWLSMGNIDEAAKVGMLFIDMVTPWRIRVQGTATLTRDPERVAQFPGANMVVDVAVDVVFQNCARYIHKHTRVETSPYVPDSAGNQPYPAWKRIEPIQPFLHPDDQGRAAQEGGTITEEEYLEKVTQGTS